jgi:membrane protease YdiL (CAAX protease family)
MVEKKISGILILLVIGLFLGVFVLVNAQELVWGALVYIVIGVVCIFLYSQWGKFGERNDLEGIGEGFWKNFLIGIGFGGATIILGQFVSFIGAIGIPPVTSIASTIGRFLVIVPLASIFEEVFFRDFLMDLLNSKLKLSRWLSILITGIGFAFFHLAAYGGSLQAAGGSFFSAALMGFVFGVVTEWRNSLATSIGYHATLNSWLGFVKLKVIVTSFLPLVKGII